MTDKAPIAVTGASGYIALHVIEQLLAQGHHVRGTLRDLSRAESLIAGLDKHVDTANLSFVQVDLTRDEGWAEAFAGCLSVIHMASPLPSGPIKNEDDLIVPARDGALRALKAANDAGIKRVVMTSSIAAIYGGNPTDTLFNETHWSDPDQDIGAYPKSKTLAERAAWDFVRGTEMELVTINPGLVLGPLIDPDGSASVEAVRKLMAREMPGCPKLGFSIVDVRDVASAHLAALTTPHAVGKRYICTGNFHWMGQIADILADHLAPTGRKVPTLVLPNWVVWLVSLFDPMVRLVVSDLGRQLHFDTSAIAKDLSWSTRPPVQTVQDTADSLIAHQIV